MLSWNVVFVVTWCSCKMSLCSHSKHQTEGGFLLSGLYTVGSKTSGEEQETQHLTRFGCRVQSDWKRYSSKSVSCFIYVFYVKVSLASAPAAPQHGALWSCALFTLTLKWQSTKAEKVHRSQLIDVQHWGGETLNTGHTKQTGSNEIQRSDL